MIAISGVERWWRIFELFISIVEVFFSLFFFFPVTKLYTWWNKNILKIKIAVLN